MWRYASAAAALLVLLFAGCHRGEVRLRLSPKADDYEWRPLISAEQFSAPCRKLFYIVVPPVGYAEARRHPLEGHALGARMRWNSIARALCEQFDELRVKHNEARITIREFDVRRSELTGALKGLTGRKAELDGELEKYRAAQESLDAASRVQGAQAVDQAREATAQMADAREKGNTTIAAARELLGTVVPPPPQEPTGESAAPSNAPAPG